MRFLAYQEEAGVSLEELGTAMARAAEEHGDHPLFVLERGEITEAEFWPARPALESGFDLTACASSSSSSSSRTRR